MWQYAEDSQAEKLTQASVFRVLLEFDYIDMFNWITGHTVEFALHIPLLSPEIKLISHG